MYQLSFYVPASHLETVKSALFATGAGQHNNNYDCCAWQTLGQGQFRPLSSSQPYLGKINQLETVAEYKVEMICPDEHIKAAIAALLATHPYQEPAYTIYNILNTDDL